VTDETGTKVPPGNATLPIEDQQKGPPMPGRRIRQRLGRRGTFLAILGTGKTCWGVSFLADPPNDHGLQLLTEVCGLRHWFGFLTAFIPPTVWAIAYTYAVIAGDYSRGAYVAIWYLTSHVGVIWWASTVPEHSVPPTPRLPRRGKAA
jgi:hypothetical protein